MPRPNPRLSIVCSIAGLAFVVQMAAPSRVDAQEVLRAAPDIAQCLCLEQEIARLDGEYKRVRDQFSARDGEARALASELDRQRGQVNVDDERAVDVFRQLVARQQAVEAERNQLIPRVQSAVDRHNEVVAEFERRCGGKYYDGALLPQVRATLSCPAR